MEPINEALQLFDLDKIQEEINERVELINQMVGSLYPAILYDEIVSLRSRDWDIRYKHITLPNE